MRANENEIVMLGMRMRNMWMRWRNAKWWKIYLLYGVIFQGPQEGAVAVTSPQPSMAIQSNSCQECTVEKEGACKGPDA